MSPWVMALGVLGIPLLALLGWLLGFAKPRRIADDAEVRTALSLRDPSAVMSDVVLDAKGRAALALLSDGRLYAVRALGDRLADRLLPPRSVRCERRRADIITLTFADVAFPALRLSLQCEAPGWLFNGDPPHAAA